MIMDWGNQSPDYWGEQSAAQIPKEVKILCYAGAPAGELLSSQVPDFRAFITAFERNVPWLAYAPKHFVFEVNKGQKCTLNNEADYQNMLLLCALLGRELVTVSIPTACSNQQNNTEKLPSPVKNKEIPDFFPAVKPNTGVLLKPFTFGSRIPRESHTTGEKKCPETEQSRHDPSYPAPPVVCGKRPAIETPASLFEERAFPPKKQATSEQQAKRKAREDRQASGEWYRGATTSVPKYGISPDEEPVVLRSANWVNYIQGKEQEFEGGVEEFRAKLVKYAAKLGFRFSYVKNNSIYVNAQCKQREEDGCKWFVKGSVSSVTKSFIIKDCNLDHTCAMALQLHDSKRMGQRVLGNVITDAIRSTPTLTATDLKRDILKYWGFTITYEKVWRCVEVARANIFGSFDDSFDELRWYAEGIQRTNPGSIVSLETEPVENRFKRFFVAFNASIQGFKKCRPMLFVDGTFMKTRYKGTLLSATAKDGNNGLFPVAMAIVDSENSENWTWFIQKLKTELHHEHKILYVSDRAGGLMNAFQAVYEKPLHFFCLYHLMKNLRTLYSAKKFSDKYKNHLCKVLKDAAYAPTIHFFDKHISKFLKDGGENAHHFLTDLPPQKWAVAFAPDVHRYGELTSNAAESFNSWILDARALPVTFMIDCIRMQLMRWFNERREEQSKWTGALTPRMEEMWHTELNIGSNWVILPTNSKGTYEVLASETCVVNLPEHKCSCYQWQVRGYPCVHAIQCITRSRWPVRTVIEPYFFTDTYREVYGLDINPIPTTEKFEFLDMNTPAKILPPVLRRVPGRPKELRYRSRGEPKHKRFICGRCGKIGNHFWTTCSEALD